MEHLRNNDSSKFHSDALESIRKIRGFNSRKDRVNDAIDILNTWAKHQDYFQERKYL